MCHLTKENHHPAKISLQLSPLIFSDQDHLPSCTSSGGLLQLCKVPSISVHLLMRSWAYETDWRTGFFLFIVQPAPPPPPTSPKNVCRGWGYTFQGDKLIPVATVDFLFQSADSCHPSLNNQLSLDLLQWGKNDNSVSVIFKFTN